MDKPISVSNIDPPQTTSILPAEPKKNIFEVKQSSKAISDSTLTLSKKEEKKSSQKKPLNTKSEKEESDIEDIPKTTEKKKLK
jgi:hypothetical protein